MKINPVLQLDFYKVDHRRQYPEGTELVYSNFTPRGSRIPGVDKVVFFGLQYYIKEYLIKQWNEGFFHRSKEEVLAEYQRMMDNTLGPNAVPVEHIGELHDLGYLPIKIMALEEGTLVPLRVPMFTIENTLPQFFWLTNMLETNISNILWMPCTSATIAYQYRKVFNEYADKTVGNRYFVQWQGHDFSYRGMSGTEAACLSGAGHLLSFTGTDTIPAIPFIEEYYNGNVEKGLIGGSVPATEHSVMCLASFVEDDIKSGEFQQFKRLITEVYPNGIVSIVSDSFDFWQVITFFLPTLKNEIMSRDGKVVIRPDSGDPVNIICGDPDAPVDSPEYKGAIECMWETFGGTITSNGHKLLDSHVGLIYGDSITLERQKQILERLDKKGFSSYNVVLGIGSYTYQHVTRDTFGFAVKATYGVVNGQAKEIYKDPKTDNGLKRSARGLVGVFRENGELVLKDRLTVDEYENNLLRTIFKDGKLMEDVHFSDIRQLLEKQ